MNNSIYVKLIFQGTQGVVIEGTKIKSCISTPNSLSIPKGISALGKSCFSGQDNLERIYLPSSVILVEAKCFANCPNLRLIKCHDNLRKFEDILKYGNNAEVIYVNFE